MKKVFKEIVFDLDGTLNDTLDTVVEYYNERNGTQFKGTDNITYDIVKSYGEEHGSVISELMSTNVAYHKPNLFKDALEIVELAKELAEDVSVWTLCHSEEVQESKKEFISKHIGIRGETVFAKDKPHRHIQGVFLDDYVPNLKIVDAEVKILITQPWNIDYRGDDVIRVASLSEAIEYLKTFRK